uniref:Uncharacterized protein n=1 Tax=Onchocerca volvulus TaxID=6282 RepID=A0A8R1XNU2_ONCVO
MCYTVKAKIFFSYSSDRMLTMMEENEGAQYFNENYQAAIDTTHQRKSKGDNSDSCVEDKMNINEINKFIMPIKKTIVIRQIHLLKVNMGYTSIK